MEAVWGHLLGTTAVARWSLHLKRICWAKLVQQTHAFGYEAGPFWHRSTVYFCWNLGAVHWCRSIFTTGTTSYNLQFWRAIHFDPWTSREFLDATNIPTARSQGASSGVSEPYPSTGGDLPAPLVASLSSPTLRSWDAADVLDSHLMKPAAEKGGSYCFTV